jgi:outer membrane receptor protein involved in Fe transport
MREAVFMSRASCPSIPVSHFRRSLCHVLIAFAALLAVPLTAGAQGSFSLGGTVRDSSGVVPGATVVISASGSDISSTTTDGAGTFRFQDLRPGSYQLAITMRGFETVVRNVLVDANTPPVDVVLSVGRVLTRLNITAAAGRATASRLPVPNDDIPAQVSSVPQELMRQQGTNTVAEALRNVSGVQAVRWYGAYEQYHDQGILRSRSRRIQHRADRRHAAGRQPLRHADQQHREH